MADDAVLAKLREEYLMPYDRLTLRFYTHWLDRYLAWCASTGRHPLHVTRSDVQHYVQSMVEADYKPKSILTALSPVRGYYRLACDDWLIESDPSARIRLPRVINPVEQRPWLDQRAMQKFLAAGEYLGGRHQAVALLLGCLALRVSEVCSLNIEDYQETVRGHRVLRYIGKGQQPCMMPLPARLLRALDAAAAGRESGALVHAASSFSPTNRSGIVRILQAILDAAEISGHWTPHMLRASCITNALQAGLPIHRVAYLAQHSNPATTMLYDRARTYLDQHPVYALMAFYASPVPPPKLIDESEIVSDPETPALPA